MADCIKVKRKSVKYTHPPQTGVSGIVLVFINQKT